MFLFIKNLIGKINAMFCIDAAKVQLIFEIRKQIK